VFDTRCNLSMIDLDLVGDADDIEVIERLLKKHMAVTGSRLAGNILDEFDACLPKFVKVFPMEYRRALGKMTKEDEAVEREVIAPR
jgi:glutamate synthase domain-containing protein 3